MTIESFKQLYFRLHFNCYLPLPTTHVATAADSLALHTMSYIAHFGRGFTYLIVDRKTYGNVFIFIIQTS